MLKAAPGQDTAAEDPAAVVDSRRVLAYEFHRVVPAVSYVAVGFWCCLLRWGYVFRRM
jgi:hypothetical protein